MPPSIVREMHLVGDFEYGQLLLVASPFAVRAQDAELGCGHRRSRLRQAVPPSQRTHPCDAMFPFLAGVEGCAFRLVLGKMHCVSEGARAGWAQCARAPQRPPLRRLAHRQRAPPPALRGHRQSCCACACGCPPGRRIDRRLSYGAARVYPSFPGLYLLLWVAPPKALADPRRQ
jgi:hypothetical protein